MLQHDPDRKLRILGLALHGLGLAIALAVLGLGYAAALRPMGEDIADCGLRIDALESLLRVAPKVLAEHEALRRELEVLRAKTEALEKRVPREPAEAEFLSQLSGAAAEVGLTIRDYRPGVVRTREDHSCLEIQLACTGSFRSLCGFLDRMASMPRLSRVTQIEVTSAAEPDAYPMTMSLAVFFDLNDRRRASVPPARKAEMRPADAGA